MANKYFLVPSDMYKALLDTERTGDMNLDFENEQVKYVKKSIPKKESTKKNILYNKKKSVI